MFQIFFIVRSCSFWKNNERKRIAEAMLKIENILNIWIFTENICSACNPMQVLVFLQTCITFAEQRLKFCHFEGSIIPWCNKVFCLPFTCLKSPKKLNVPNIF